MTEGRQMSKKQDNRGCGCLIWIVVTICAMVAAGLGNAYMQVQSARYVSDVSGRLIEVRPSTGYINGTGVFGFFVGAFIALIVMLIVAVFVFIIPNMRRAN